METNQFSKNLPQAAGEKNEREAGSIVYSVYSRRSQGLSIGINLFPDKKRCCFNCPYCEVFDFSANAVFSLDKMEKDLCAAVADSLERKIPIMDICFSGSGEPSLSPVFPQALEIAGRVRDELARAAELVFITNGSWLLDPQVFTFLAEAADGPLTLDIWLKLDAGTQEWYEKINRSAIPFEILKAQIKEFAGNVPVTIQTMLCAIDGYAPPPHEEKAWEKFMLELALAAQANRGLRKVQVYGKARTAPQDPKASALPAEYLEKRAAALRKAFSAVSINTPVEVYP